MKPRSWIFLLTALTFISLVAVLAQCGVTVFTFLKFLLGLGAVIYLPGLALLRLARVEADRLETVTLSLVLGLTSSTLVYRIAGLVGFPPLFVPWPIAALAVLLWKAKKPVTSPVGRISLSTWTTAGLVAVFLLIGLVLYLDNFRNGLLLPNGSLRINAHYYDGMIRNAVVRELSHSIPPQMPFASGLPLSYHYGMDLFVAAFHRHLGLGVLDLLHRLTITFFFGLLVLSLFIFVRRLTRSPSAALLSTVLVVFGSGGFAYVGALPTGYPSYWGKIFYSFYLLDLLSVNSFLPALAVLSAGLYCLHAFLETRRPGWLLASGFLLSVVVEYKISLAVPVLASLAASALIFAVRFKDWAPLKVFVLTAVMTTLLLLAAYLYNAEGPSFTWTLKLNNWIIFALGELKLGFLGRVWAELTLQYHFTAETLLLAPPILALFFVGSFGFGILALPQVIRDFFRPRREDICRFVLAAFILSGTAFFFLVKPFLGAEDRSWINIYVYLAGAVVLTILWAEKLTALLRKRRGAAKFALVVLVLILSLPNSVQFLRTKILSPQPLVFDSDFLEACSAIEKHTEKEGAVLHSTEMRYVCYFASRRVVLDRSRQSYLGFHLTQEQRSERISDIERFYADPEHSADVLSKYDVASVLVQNKLEFKDLPTDESGCIISRSSGESGDRRGGPDFTLTPVFKSRSYSLYRVDSR